MDVPRGCFVMPAEAWKQCREGCINPKAFGIFELRGLWFIAGNLVKDVASLNQMEMLQWHAWGVMPRPNNSMRDKKRLQFFDALAELASDPDASFEDCKKCIAKKTNRLLVPARVFNTNRRHLEKI